MIVLSNVCKQFGAGQDYVSNNISLTIPPREMTCIIGQSGQGKSVLLKQIIGLIKPTSGSITINGREVTTMDDDDLHDLFSYCGYVFQSAALLDSLTIFENIGISLLERNVPYETVVATVEEKMGLVDLPHSILSKYPSQLSGGMQKRVGLARTLVANPEILLYDEPTTGLDPITARIVFELMYSMQQQLNITSLVISHDTSIFKYVDNVALLHNGSIEYFGKAHDVWTSDNPYIHQFIRGLQDGPIHTEQHQAAPRHHKKE